MSKAKTNDGTDTPITDKIVANVSQKVFLCNAAKTPNAMPITVPKITAEIPKLNDICAASPTKVATGISLYILKETPKSPVNIFLNK